VSGLETAPRDASSQGSGLRAHLRAATVSDHARLDTLGARFDFASPLDYAAFLSAHAALLPGIETRIAEGPLPPNWPARQRTAALAADLSSLGLAPPDPAHAPALDSPSMRVGALYVLEGSRLGGAVLRRRLHAARPGAPCAYLSHGADQQLWPSFVAWLDGLELDSVERGAAAEGAKLTFGAFDYVFRCWLRDASG
jgi:heme oxygenase